MYIGTKVFTWSVFALLHIVFCLPAAQAAVLHHHGSMIMDNNSMVMGQNVSTLPKDCKTISVDTEVTVHVGRKYAKSTDIFAYDKPRIQLEPCARIKITLINDDNIRHQWMVHGLPRYLYDGGMFHLEVNGGHTVTGTFIVPSYDKNYFIHCDMAQHTEKGLVGKLTVGNPLNNNNVGVGVVVLVLVLIIIKKRLI